MGSDLRANERALVEKFSEVELSSLRTELMQAGIDSWQAAEVLSMFLAGRGYGVNPENARTAISRLEGGRCDYQCMQAELEKVAWTM
jgi:hypothetical protein